MKIGIKVLPRREILDTQGRAVERVLKQKNFGDIQCRVGKFIEIELDAKTNEEAEAKVKSMAEYVLYNPLIETYEIESHES